MASDKSQLYEHPLARENLQTLKALQTEGQTMTGFFKWGFIIYRCDYSDDALFDRFVAYLRDQAEDYHRLSHQDRTTGLYLQWTVVQDRKALDGATKDQARQRFVEWRDGLSVGRDGPGADHRVTPYLPRFEYCVHVGRDSLDSLIAHEEAPQAGKSKCAVTPVFFAVVRAAQRPAGLPEGYDDPKEGDEGDDYIDDSATKPPAIEGCTDQGVGWMYVAADDWVELYEELHVDQAWYILYRRPPGVVKV
ncbi:hypothetical protein KVR01_001991 [Diaporthe batatas]|uniref:uncharacterized protein n=1 Tax=Diaporthe batatas TaxID=748121 RepID=UPI001D03F9E5|nr:uncharacterized protein KVR01_001991 [Diaporthe batatas]KAG8169242.1 hypothetical protein KVR01_001991 [Diaporthe batatas]